jgi:hypothetical protein
MQSTEVTVFIILNTTPLFLAGRRRGEGGRVRGDRPTDLLTAFLETTFGEFATGPKAAVPLPSRIMLCIASFGNRVLPYCVEPLYSINRSAHIYIYMHDSAQYLRAAFDDSIQEG